MARFDQIVEELKLEFRTFRLVPKDGSSLMKVIYYGLLMFLWCPDFMTTYTTVLISRVYMPQDLFGTHAGYQVLRHERVHMRDCFRSGVLPFILSYLFFLPCVVTLRSVWEMRAYEESMRVEYETTGEVADSSLRHIERRFTSSAYLWMCPFPALVRRWLRRVRARVMACAGQESQSK